MYVKKITTIFILTIFILSFFPIPVYAGWQNWFKSTFKFSAKNSEDIVKHSDDMVKHPEEQKQLLKSEKQKRLINNKKKGFLWEKEVEETLCLQTKCYSDYNAVEKNFKNYGYFARYNEKHFIITGGKNTKKFINQKIDENFINEPDFIEVYQDRGKITKIKIIDAKTSKEAKRYKQDQAFKELCIKSRFECEVEYAIPKNKLNGKDLVDTICLLSFGNIMPDPIDAVCLLTVFA